MNLQVTGRIGFGFDILAVVSTRYAGFTDDGQGLTQVFVHGAACVAGEVQTQAAQAVAQAVQLAFVHGIACGHAIAHAIDDVATEVNVAIGNVDDGACGVADADAIGAVRGVITQGVGHFGASGGQIGDVAIGVGQH